MNNALFIMNGIEQEISVDLISSRKEYLEKYRDHLFCPHPNCSARLTFAETPMFTQKKIFKTAKNSMHSENCPYKINYSEGSKLYYTSETITHALSDRHKHDILKKLYSLNQNTGNKTNENSVVYSKTRKKTKNTEVVSTPSTKASINPDALPAPKGIREAVVKKRHSSDILHEDIGKLLGLDGYAKAAVFRDDYVEIILDSNVTLLFYNAFRDSSTAAFSLVKDLVSDFITNKQDLLICFIGIVEEKNTGYQIQIMDPSLITFNDFSIYNYKTIS